MECIHYTYILTYIYYYERKNINPTINEKILNPPLPPRKYTTTELIFSSKHNRLR